MNVKRTNVMVAWEESDLIPAVLFDQIVKLMPIVSVEAIIVMDKSLLFLRRKNEPAKGEWWFAGGRIRKEESLKETLVREVKEVGLKISAYKLINAYSRVFPMRHDITIAYLCKCKKGKVTLNNEHSEHKLLKSIPVGLHPYLLETIQDSQWEKHV